MNPFQQKSSAHWYRADGSPSHDSDLRDARKNNLYFSVTSILKAWPKDMLDAWKLKNVVNLCIENPIKKRPKETPAQYQQRIADLASAQLNEAAQWGRTIHAMFEQYAKTQTFPEVEDTFKPYAPKIEEWFSENINEVILSEQILVSKDFGYAGTCDLVADTKHWGVAVCDFKRRGFYRDKPNTYDTDPMQLEAYARCLGFGTESLVSVGVDRDEPRIASVQWPQHKHEEYWTKFIACYKMTCLSKNYMPQIQFELPI